ncbi:MAG TPA: hypothetical protein VNS32_17385 [Flavisolibacter sp.]|nr:hypothetical protein [Flavisolibacter sp.]
MPDKLYLTSLFKPFSKVAIGNNSSNWTKTATTKAFRTLSILTLLFLFSCSKKDSSSNVSDTKLKLTITNNLNNPVSGAIVRLYATANDLLNQANPIGASATTDYQGQVTFSGLSASKYYWLAQNGCANNVNDYVTSGENLNSGITNTARITIKETGTLVLTNNSKDPYIIYLNGTQLSNPMAGSTSVSVKYALTGSYTVRVVQQSGYIITPTDKSYSGVLSCGSTLRAVFPN